jgi:dolichol kinase
LGRENKYHLLGHTKSVVGTTTFVVVSLLVFMGYGIWSVAGLGVPIMVFGALAAAILENIAPFGLDNIAVPVFVALLLRY